MAAAQQVLDTAELLEIIICQCEPHQVQELKLVSRSWRDSINSSKAVRRSLVLETGYFEELHSREVGDAVWDWDTTCSYLATDWVRLNPAFEKVHPAFGQLKHGRTYYEITIVLPQALDPAPNLEQFVTTPPISDITVGTRCWSSSAQKCQSPHYDNVCTAHNKNGLKIKDVLNVRNALIATQRKFKATRILPEDTMVQAGFQVEGENAVGDGLED